MFAVAKKSRKIIVWQPLGGSNAQALDTRLQGQGDIGRFSERLAPVFNLEQIEGIQHPSEPNKTLSQEVLGRVASWITLTSVAIEKSGADAFYSSSEDCIIMPKIGTFSSQQDYFRTLFHLWVHWTGHPQRLKRESFQDVDFERPHFFTFEELVAEVGVAMLSCYAGLPFSVITDTADYLSRWHEFILGEPRMLLQAATQAQKSVDFITGTQPEARAQDT